MSPARVDDAGVSGPYSGVIWKEGSTVIRIRPASFSVLALAGLVGLGLLADHAEHKFDSFKS